MQRIEKLSLIFVQSLDLYVEYRIGIYVDAVVVFDILCKTYTDGSLYSGR